MDINGFSRLPLGMEDSNPGKVEYCPGGVGRNIAENLHRLGLEVRFIGAIGDDPGGELIKTFSANMGLNIENSLFLKSDTSKGDSPITSVYLAMMDSNGEMRLALSDMEIMEKMTEEHLESKADLIKESAIVVLDTNLPEKIIQFIMDRYGDAGPRFFLDAVSAKKAPRAASRIGLFDTLKLGCMEASALSGIEIPGKKLFIMQQEKLKKAAQNFLGKGAGRVFITLGKKGVYTATDKKAFFNEVRFLPPVNTTGAGDAFMAGIVYGTLQGWDDEAIVSFSLAMAGITVQSKHAVSTDMSLELVMSEVNRKK